MHNVYQPDYDAGLKDLIKSGLSFWWNFGSRIIQSSAIIHNNLFLFSISELNIRYKFISYLE